jgi:uncharacterized protein (TIGR03382 family)
MAHFSSLAGPGALVALAAMAVVLTAGACSGPSGTQPPSSSSAPASAASSSALPPGSSAPASHGRTTLHGDLHPLARAAIDVGRVDPATPLSGVSLLFQMSPAQKARQRLVLADLQDPRSPSYHRWLTPERYAAWFGASAEDIARATAWLQAQGFTVHGPSPTGTRLLFSGSAVSLEQAFHTELHHYEANGARHFALAGEPSVPADLAPAVLGLRGVHDFHLRPSTPPRHGRAVPEYALPPGGATATLALAPADFAKVYDLDALYAQGITGAGQRIAIVGESDFHDGDIAAFRKTFGLSTSNVPTRDFVSFSGKPTVSYDTFGEAELDLEWAGAVAPDASIFHVFTGDNPTYDAFDAVLYAIDKGTYPIISVSFAGCEYGITQNEIAFLETMGDAAAMEGVTVVNGTGDWGAAGCDYATTSPLAAQQGLYAGWPATTPSFVAVGGTALDWGDPLPEPTVTAAMTTAAPFSTYWSCTTGPLACSAKGAVPETGWNEVAWQIAHNHYFWGASGGGISKVYPKPYWQVGQTLAGQYRQVPDVALTAAWSQVGYVISTSWTAADGDASAPYAEDLSASGGTSAATPSFAGMLALVNQALAAKNPGLPAGLGNANPVLYAIHASTKGTASAAFRDVTTGSNVVPCEAGTPDCPGQAPYQYGYNAAAGYDLVTGLGSVDGHNLVSAWTELTPTHTTLTATPSATNEGDPVSVSAVVASNATTSATALTGSVLFYVDTVDDAGTPTLSLYTAAPLTATSAGTQGGTATASVVVPPGTMERGNVVAFYAGDAHYLASWSQAQSIGATSTFAAAPLSITIRPNEQTTFTTSGGVAPVVWVVVRDGTCDPTYIYCSQVVAATSMTATFQAGPEVGTVLVAAIDGDGAEGNITVHVAGSPVDGGPLPPPWDSGAGEAGPPDGGPTDDGATGDDAHGGDDATAGDDAAGTDAHSGGDASVGPDGGPTLDAAAPVDAGTQPPHDAPGFDDAATGNAAGTQSEVADDKGCSCTAAGANGGGPSGAWLLTALAAVGARRRRPGLRRRAGRRGRRGIE